MSKLHRISGLSLHVRDGGDPENEKTVDLPGPSQLITVERFLKGIAFTAPKKKRHRRERERLAIEALTNNTSELDDPDRNQSGIERARITRRMAHALSAAQANSVSRQPPHLHAQWQNRKWHEHSPPRQEFLPRKRSLGSVTRNCNPRRSKPSSNPPQFNTMSLKFEPLAAHEEKLETWHHHKQLKR